MLINFSTNRNYQNVYNLMLVTLKPFTLRQCHFRKCHGLIKIKITLSSPLTWVTADTMSRRVVPPLGASASLLCASSMAGAREAAGSAAAAARRGARAAMEGGSSPRLWLGASTPRPCSQQN